MFDEKRFDILIDMLKYLTQNRVRGNVYAKLSTKYLDMPTNVIFDVILTVARNGIDVWKIFLENKARLRDHIVLYDYVHKGDTFRISGTITVSVKVTQESSLVLHFEEGKHTKYLVSDNIIDSYVTKKHCMICMLDDKFVLQDKMFLESDNEIDDIVAKIENKPKYVECWYLAVNYHLDPCHISFYSVAYPVVNNFVDKVAHSVSCTKVSLIDKFTDQATFGNVSIAYKY